MVLNITRIGMQKPSMVSTTPLVYLDESSCSWVMANSPGKMKLTIEKQIPPVMSKMIVRLCDEDANWLSKQADIVTVTSMRTVVMMYILSLVF